MCLIARSRYAGSSRRSGAASVDEVVAGAAGGADRAGSGIATCLRTAAPAPPATASLSTARRVGRFRGRVTSLVIADHRDHVDFEQHFTQAIGDGRACGERRLEVLAIELVVFGEVGCVLHVRADLRDL